MQRQEIVCLSVLGGWQSAFKDSEFKFGPVFNKIQDLWSWQRHTLYVGAAQ